MPRRRVVTGLVAFLVVLAGSGISAGPTIIRDNRISDLALTPVLGRGYSMATNTFQSTCLKDIKYTPPSYDFNYTFESLDSEALKKMASSVEFGLDVSYMGFDVNTSGKRSALTEERRYYQNIRVVINVDTYYASVDESKTQLSDSARILLENNDIPGFFSSCGSYYIRSIGRNAKFVSLFTYLSESEKADKNFELQLEIAIKGFGSMLTQALAGGDPSASLHISRSIYSLAQKNRLTITTKAWGLGKSENASLIAFDLKTYQEAIVSGFKSMQDPLTGRVTTMELVPWVENADFQRYIKLEEGVSDASGQKILLFEKKHILNENAEFLARIDRTARNMMDLYYKALICRQIIDTNWKRETSRGKKEFLSHLKDASIQNNKVFDKTLAISELDNELSPATIEGIYEQEKLFMYGDPGRGVIGARDCIKTIMKDGIFRKSWRDIDACKEIRKKFTVQINETIDDYCMPSLAKPKEK